jgi:hypothetical protein
MKEKLEREIRFRPAYDKRDPDPKKNYGIHGVEMCWYLKGAAGTVQFIVFTNWHLPHVAKETDTRILKEAQMGVELKEYSSMATAPRKLDRCSLHCSYHPTPADLGFHSKVEMYEGQKQMMDNCEMILGGGPCYYDGSGMQAEELFKLLVEQGDEAVWQEMEARYYETLVGVANKEEAKQLGELVHKLIEKAKK